MTIPSGRSADLQLTTLHLSIHGIVQGVGFRDALSVQAVQCDLDGWVRNRRDGSVEAVIQGAAQAIEALLRWARRGPPAARVDRLDVHPADSELVATVQPGFRRLPTA